MKEDKFPLDDRRAPDLRYYTDSLEYYIEMYEQHLGALQGRAGPGYEVELAFRKRVHGVWGLIARGSAAATYALGLLQRTEPEAREDGAAILAELGRDEGVVEELVDALRTEKDTAARDSLVAGLGRLKSRRAIPILAAIIRGETEDGDTRWSAVESLGLIVRKRFLKQDDPVRAAEEWLDKHPAALNQARDANSAT